ncbi:MAG: hypothetical protein K2L07_10375 [Lachnospiraceae bacterium]|nr:hypothetical protein [Lachnospiraceae bacterium]
MRKKDVWRSVRGMQAIHKVEEKAGRPGYPGRLCSVNWVCFRHNSMQGYKMQHPELSDNYLPLNGETRLKRCLKPEGE